MKVKVIVMSSPDAVLRGGSPDPKMVNAIKEIASAGIPVGLISNHSEPDWFSLHLNVPGVNFVREYGRQDGEIVGHNAKAFGLRPFDVLVLAIKGDDVAMGKNGKALLLGAGWSSDPKVKALGVQVDTPADLAEIAQLVSDWTGQWYFKADTSAYRIRALSDLSTMKYGLTQPQQAFAVALTNTVKNGGNQLKALLAVTARSILMEGLAGDSKLLFGTYPSSKSDNSDSEVLSDFVHRLRTTVSQVRMAARGEPLFIRHKRSIKRSGSNSVNRTDPSDQLLTLHLNPYYGQKGRLSGRHVIVVDDCTTYGVSFAVAAALLRAGGAAQVTGIALGKFGNQARQYDIVVSGNPFRPLKAEQFQVKGSGPLSGTMEASAQATLHKLVAD